MEGSYCASFENIDSLNDRRPCSHGWKMPSEKPALKNKLKRQNITFYKFFISL